MPDSLYLVAELVAPAFLVIGLGTLYNLIFKKEVEPLAKISMNVLVPAFAFVHLYRMKIDPNLISTVFLSAWIILLAPGVAAWGVFRRWEMPHRGLYLPIMFMNTVNLPFPIILSAYGEEAFPFALMFYLASIVGVFTLGLLIVSSGRGSFQIFQEPVVYAIVLGLYMNFESVDLPPILVQPIALLESATIPMVLLVLGMQLARVRLTQLKWPLIAVCFRFTGGILAGLACVSVFGLEGLPRKVVLLEAVMPSAVINALLAEKYQADADLVASAVLLSTVIGIGLIPLALYLIG